MFLADNELLRVLANRLWVYYDLGGISMGRSIQAILLEGVITLLSMNPIKISVTDEELVVEAAKRSVPYQGIIFSTIGFDLMPENMKLQYLLSWLNMIYQGDKNFPYREKQIIMAMAKIAPLPPGKYYATIEEIQSYFLGYGQEREYVELNTKLQLKLSPVI